MGIRASSKRYPWSEFSGGLGIGGLLAKTCSEADDADSSPSEGALISSFSIAQPVKTHVRTMSEAIDWHFESIGRPFQIDEHSGPPSRRVEKVFKK
jgi:hypothetical protein